MRWSAGRMPPMTETGRGYRPRFMIALAFLLFFGTACHVHTHRVGGGATGIGEESARQYYIFFGLMPLNEVDAQRMAGDLVGYEVTTERSLVDYLLMPALGLATITSRTVTVRR